MMQLPTEFGLYKATNAGHAKMVSDCLAVANQEFAQLHGISNVYNQVKSLLDIELDCLALHQALANTEEVERLDSERDRLFVYINKVVAAATLLPLPDMAQAGARLHKQLSPFKGANDKPYEDNSQLIETYVLRMSQTPFAQDIATLGLTPVMEALSSTNELFSQTYMGRTTELRQRVKGETMKTIRPRVEAAFAEYLQLINALYQVNEQVLHDEAKKQSLQAIITDIDGRIIQFQITIDRRLGTSGPDGENGTGIENDTPENGTGENNGNESAGNENDTPSGDENSGETGGDDNENTGGGNEGGTTPPPPAGNDDDEEIIG